MTTWGLYGRLSALLVILTLMVGFNLARWGMHRVPTTPVLYVPEGDPQRGRGLAREHGCGACHIIPGVRGAVGEVGPPLDRMRLQNFIAGVLPNAPPNLTAWIMHPKEHNPRTAMPDLDVSEPDARDIAAYLYALE